MSELLTKDEKFFEKIVSVVELKTTYRTLLRKVVNESRGYGKVQEETIKKIKAALKRDKEPQPPTQGEMAE